MSTFLTIWAIVNWQLLCSEAKSMPWDRHDIETNGIDNGSSDNNEIDEMPIDPNARINLSMPGTKWCGPGSTANGYDDLGTEREVDMCCRDHDHCDNIPAGQTKYNLTNKDYFTRLDCDCDRKFRKCLRTINSSVSNRVGHIYFTLRNKCYHDDYPIIKCTKYDTFVFFKRCVQYKLDWKQPKRYQWFDIPMYRDEKERTPMTDEENYILIRAGDLL